MQIFKYINLEKSRKEKLLKEISLIKNDFLQIIIKNDLSWKEVAQISSNITELRGVFIEMILRRSYNSFSFPRCPRSGDVTSILCTHKKKKTEARAEPKQNPEEWDSASE